VNEINWQIKAYFPHYSYYWIARIWKTTLAAQLSRKLKVPVFRIGAYRSSSFSPIGEADAWVALFKDLSRRRWSNCVLETTGLNQRESFLGMAFPLSQMITIKLDAPRSFSMQELERKGRKSREGSGCSAQIIQINTNL